MDSLGSGNISHHLPNNSFRNEIQGDGNNWEYHKASVTRVPGYGFGIAVSGGRDNPHFANGDPSIAVSDVLKGGPAELRLQVNDRIISVNGVSLENVEYATAVQVLRDSGNTVSLVVKRRASSLNILSTNHHHNHHHLHQHHQHQQSLNSSIGILSNGLTGPSSPTATITTGGGIISGGISGNQQQIKVAITKANKKDDFGLVLGCRLFIKEISSKTKDQLAMNGYSLQEGDIVTRLHNTNTNDTMSLKEAKKIIDGCKERLNISVIRDMLAVNGLTSSPSSPNGASIGGISGIGGGGGNGGGGMHAQQGSNCSNLEDSFFNSPSSGGVVGSTGGGGAVGGGIGGNNSYSAQNLYVQHPTRSIMNVLLEDKSNLTPRGRSRNPLMDVSLLQLDRPSTPQQRASVAAAAAASGGVTNSGTPTRRTGGGNGNSGGTSTMDQQQLTPTRSLPSSATSPGGGIGTGGGGGEEALYSSRRQLYEEDPLRRSRQSAEPRFISFQKEGSVGIRLTGGNEAGVFVTAVQPGSPASLQGLTPGDKILKVNDMDMTGVTREEAVLFLLSLQDRIDLIVQHCREEYDNVVANQRGDSFHIKTHFHCDNPSKGEMSFKAGDIFRVVDTLHNGVVGAWQVLRIGSGQQEIQRGVIPNKSRAEELATAQFNATKKDTITSESSSSRSGFFRRRRPTHRRSKSLSRENRDDVEFSDSFSKFPAYERVVLRHPGFVRPVVMFGPVADLARTRLIKDFPDKFTVPLKDANASDKTTDDGGGGGSSTTATKSSIVRLSNIRDIMDRGKHALLDVTPNAVDRLNYAQFYPIVIFLKADNKHQIKALRQGVPKSEHKSSKKLLEQCQKLNTLWSHIFSNVVTLTDADTWYRKLRDVVDELQSGAVWMSETKPVESLSDDFLFPMATSRLSYASSPESDLELSPGPSTSLSLGNLPQLIKSSSDPSIATNQDNLERIHDLNINETMPPPYTHLFDNNKTNEASDLALNSSSYSQLYYGTVPDLPPRIDRTSKPPGGYPVSPTSNGQHGNGGIISSPSLSSSGPSSMSKVNSSSTGTMGRSAQERLFGGSVAKRIITDEFNGGGGVGNSHDEYSRSGMPPITSPTGSQYKLMKSSDSSLDRNKNSLDRTPQRSALFGSGTNNIVNNKTNESYDSVSSYDSCNTTQISMQQRLGPNAPDDLKSVPASNHRLTDSMTAASGDDSLTKIPGHHKDMRNGQYKQNTPNRSTIYGGTDPIISQNNRAPPQQSINNLDMDLSAIKKQLPTVETKTDYGKYSRNNSASQADYARTPKSPQMSGNNGNNGNGGGGGGSFKPVPPPKPKNYRPGPGNNGGPQINSGNWDSSGKPTSPRSVPNAFVYPPTASSSSSSHPNHHYNYHSSHLPPPPPPQMSSHHQQQPPPPPPNGNGNNIYNHHHQPPPPQQHQQQLQQQQQQQQHYNQYGGGNGIDGHHYTSSPPQQHPSANGHSGYGPPQPTMDHYAMHRMHSGNVPLPPNNHHGVSEHQALDLAGSREQRGSAFELYRKPRLGIAGGGGGGQHPNMRHTPEPQYISQSMYSSYEMTNYYNQQQMLSPPPMPPSSSSSLLLSSASQLPPPLKPKKKSFLRSPFSVLKKVFSPKSSSAASSSSSSGSGALKRQNSLIESSKYKIRPQLRRQHSMVEPGGGYNPNYHQQHHYHHQQQQHQMFGSSSIPPPSLQSGPPGFATPRDYHEYYYGTKHEEFNPRQHDQPGTSTYTNLETESIYGNTTERISMYGGGGGGGGRGGNCEQENVYANRAFIELERQYLISQTSAAAAAAAANDCMALNDDGQCRNGGGTSRGTKVVRRHSMADRATSALNNQYRQKYQGNEAGSGGGQTCPSPECTEGIYQTRTGAFLLENSQNRRHEQMFHHHNNHQNGNGGHNNAIGSSSSGLNNRNIRQRTESPIYVTKRKESNNNNNNNNDRSSADSSSATNSQTTPTDNNGGVVGANNEVFYQSRRELKERGFKTRTQLRDHIYQSRRDAMESMAEPIYVSKREIKHKPSFDSTKEHIDEIANSVLDSLGNKQTRFTETMVHNITESENDLTLTGGDKNITISNNCDLDLNKKTEPTIMKQQQQQKYDQHSPSSDSNNLNTNNGSSSEDLLTAISNLIKDSELTSTILTRRSPPLPTPPPPPLSSPPLAPPSITLPPPPSPPAALKATSIPLPIIETPNLTDLTHQTSRLSLETQYTTTNSMASSLAIGPPCSQSTPYESNMTLVGGGRTSGGGNIYGSDNNANGNGGFPPIRDQTTTRGIFDENGGTLSDDIWNVSVQIPKGAIPRGVKQEIYFTVTDPRHTQAVGGPPLDMENGETMLSPLVMCGPQGLQFLLPITLKIPHCAGRTSSLGLALKATDSEKNLCTNWDNIELPSNAAAHVVSVSVDHF